jgi:hypothetical protein
MNEPLWCSYTLFNPRADQKKEAEEYREETAILSLSPEGRWPDVELS